MWERCSTSIQDVGGLSIVCRKTHKRFGRREGTPCLQRMSATQAKQLGNLWDWSEKKQCQISPASNETGEEGTQTTTFWGSKWRRVGWLYSRELSVIQMTEQDYSSLKQRSIPWLWFSSRDALWWGIDVPLSWFYCRLFCLTLNKKKM